MPLTDTVRINGVALREFRVRERYSLKGLAEQVGISHSALSAFEREEKSPSTRTLHGIARALGVPSAAITRDAEDDDCALAPPQATDQLIGEAIP